MEQVVKDTYDTLIKTIRKYRPGTSLKLIEDAFKMAYEGHIDQRRKTGEPFILHPLSVAIILAEIRTDLESIAAGILHDVIEDTEYTMDDIEARFGEDVALLVGGVTKIKKVEYVSKTDRQAENYRKMFFHMSQDVRVLLVKIADRLHNMRTIDGHSSEEKQKQIAQETLDIYAPLAHRLGIAKLRYELEDLGFKYTNRKLYDELKKKVEIKQSERQTIVENLMEEIRERLREDGILAKVEGRAKRFYSTHKKMISQNKTLEQLYDLYAIRVLVDDSNQCYEVLGRLHEMYTPIPGRFKDYIGMKKPNGYQSLHTGLMSQGVLFEVQVRTMEMHAVAEYGIAAHWRYKEGGKAAKDKWLQEIMDWQRTMSDGDEYLDALKMDLNAFQEHIYCFTPRGEIVQLVSGSCAIDYAYSIHSAVGNRMTGARVNGKIVPVDHMLNTGDQVEIITSQNTKGPSREWLRIVKSNTARTKITQWFNKESRSENIKKGRDALEQAAKLEDITVDELLADKRDLDLLERFNCKNLDQLYAMIGVGGLKEKIVVHHLMREYEKTLPPPTDNELIQSLIDSSGKVEKHKLGSGIVVKGIGDTQVRFAKCCGPLPGDEILGFVTRGRGLTVHRTDCINILHMDEFDRRRLIEAQWQTDPKKELSFHTEMRITGDDRDGLLADVSRILSDEKIKIRTMNARTIQSEAVFVIGMEIASGEQLNALTKKINNVPGVGEVTRVSS
ncbi:MAG: bifunctional (p)ppGpp synthetase/guanosine-3',5'-bis(diphosphate) 3'-pyrophosphohydrolase [Defluviitaleaceae bacterium]|nr:bifunctional (p)ppGpp synthetase/guanosine-3',5'-bis(diphosphate) 3'-pyrophosphohydrolase [Defluviitaleaceae bacterium]